MSVKMEHKPTNDCISTRCAVIADKISDRQDDIMDFLRTRSVAPYIWLEENYLRCNVQTDANFRKTFGGYYRMRFVTQEYRDAFFALFEEIKAKQPLSFPEIAQKLFAVNQKHEFSFITKMMHTIEPNRPIYDSQVRAILNIRRKQVKTLEEKLAQDVEILEMLQELYRELETSHRIDAPLQRFDRLFLDCKISTTKKIDFILWALGAVELKKG
ncbi:MAG: hypothetical protein RRY65_01000 [Pseudoflavonifractor sp.]